MINFLINFTKIFRIIGGILTFSLILVVLIKYCFKIDYFPFLEKLLFYPNLNSNNVTDLPIGFLVLLFSLIFFVKGDGIINYLERKS